MTPDEIERLKRRIQLLEEENARLRTPGSGDRRLQAAEEALAESEERYRTLFESIDEGFCIIEFFDGPHGPLSDYVHVEANPAYALHAGIPNVVGQKLREMVGEEADAWVARYGAVLRTGKPIRFEQELVATGRHLELAAFRIEPASRRQVAVLFQDVTSRKRAEEALQRLNETLERRVADALAERMKEQERLRLTEEALRQSQKMEAVGQLTGGIAHDFNNLLTGIMGSLELLHTRMNQGRLRDADRYILAAQAASRRAASLIHRLLAFSRRQTLDPKPTDVNRLVVGMEELIRRDYPNLTVHTTATEDEAISMVSAKKADMTMRSLIVAAYTIKKQGLFNVKIAGQLPYYSNNLCIGIAQGDGERATIRARQELAPDCTWASAPDVTVPMDAIVTLRDPAAVGGAERYGALYATTYSALVAYQGGSPAPEYHGCVRRRMTERAPGQ